MKVAGRKGRCDVCLRFVLRKPGTRVPRALGSSPCYYWPLFATLGSPSQLLCTGVSPATYEGGIEYGRLVQSILYTCGYRRCYWKPTMINTNHEMLPCWMLLAKRRACPDFIVFVGWPCLHSRHIRLRPPRPAQESFCRVVVSVSCVWSC